MKKLLILSGKGGTGKTTVAAAFIDMLGAAACADCDVDAPNLHLVASFGGEPERSDYMGSQKAAIDAEKCAGCGACLPVCRFGAVRLNGGRFEIDEYACEGCGVCAHVCPAGAIAMSDDVAGEKAIFRRDGVFSTAKLKMGRGNSGKLVTEVKNALFRAAPSAPIAVIDGSPGIGCPVIASVTGVTLALIVAEPSRSGIHDMERILETAGILGVPTAVCVNKFDVSPEKSDEIERFCAENGVPFVGRIPFDSRASDAINAGHSLASVDCPAREALAKALEKTLKLLEK